MMKSLVGILAAVVTGTLSSSQIYAAGAYISQNNNDERPNILQPQIFVPSGLTRVYTSEGDKSSTSHNDIDVVAGDLLSPYSSKELTERREQPTGTLEKDAPVCRSPSNFSVIIGLGVFGLTKKKEEYFSDGTCAYVTRDARVRVFENQRAHIVQPGDAVKIEFLESGEIYWALFDSIKGLPADQNVISFEPEMVQVPGGCYHMESLSHRVCVDDFEMGKYEVTQSEWHSVMGDNPSSYQGANRPVEYVSWAEVHDFIDRINEHVENKYRLPTEAEWEYACRSGGKDETYCGGNNVGEVAWFGENSGGETHAVGTKRANGLGLHDLSGNVLEFTCSRFSSSHGEEDRCVLGSDNSRGGASELPSGTRVVTRGGAFNNPEKYLRSAYRDWYAIYGGFWRIGFRLAQDPVKQESDKLGESEKTSISQKHDEPSSAEDKEKRLESAIEKYIPIIRQKIVEHWGRPEGRIDSLEADINVRLDEAGQVLSARIVKSSGHFTFDRSIENAVLKASPLPIPREHGLNQEFRNLTFKFRPDYLN